MHYVYPLRNHGANFDIIFDKSTDAYELKMNFSGNALERWNRIALIFCFFNEANILNLQKDPHFNAMGLHFQLRLDLANTNSFEFELIKRCGDFTLSQENTLLSSFPDLFKLIEQKKGKTFAAYFAKTYTTGELGTLAKKYLEGISNESPQFS